MPKSKKKSIAIVGFSSRLIVGLATNRDALSKTFPSVNENSWTWDLSYRQDKRQIVIRLNGKGEVVKPL